MTLTDNVMEYGQDSHTDSRHLALLCAVSRRVASRHGLSDQKIHSLPTSNFTTTALLLPEWQ